MQLWTELPVIILPLSNPLVSCKIRLLSVHVYISLVNNKSFYSIYIILIYINYHAKCDISLFFFFSCIVQLQLTQWTVTALPTLTCCSVSIVRLAHSRITGKFSFFVEPIFLLSKKNFRIANFSSSITKRPSIVLLFILGVISILMIFMICINIDDCWKEWSTNSFE